MTFLSTSMPIFYFIIYQYLFIIFYNKIEDIYTQFFIFIIIHSYNLSPLVHLYFLILYINQINVLFMSN